MSWQDWAPWAPPFHACCLLETTTNAFSIKMLSQVNGRNLQAVAARLPPDLREGCVTQPDPISCWGTFRWKRPIRYLGCKQRLRMAVDDNIGLEP